MAEQLEIIIGANVDDAKAGINEINNILTNFGNQGKLSIKGLEVALVNLKKQIKITTDPAEAKKLGDALGVVQAKLNSLKIEGGLATQLGGISRATRTAHADLEQMAQSIRGFATGSERGVDAIGNLVFTFERLQGITGGAGAAVSALGETLLGPAGLVLAFTTLVPLIIDFVSELFNSEGAAEANQKAFDDLNATLADSKKAFEALQTQVKFLDQIGPINLDIQFGKGFQTDILELNARVVELNDEILAQQKVIADAQNARIAADKAVTDAEINNGKKVIEEKKKQATEALKAEEDANKKLIDLQNERSVLFRKTEETRTQNQRDADKKRAEDAKAAATELNRTLIALAKEAEKAFDIPLRLKFDSTDLDVEKLRKAREILAGIKDFTIKARIDIELPDIKELPKEQVEKFFKNVPNALQDAIDKGLISPEPIELFIQPKAIGEDAFSKEIQDILDKFNKAGVEIPLSIQVDAATGKLQAGSADFLKALLDAFKPVEVEKKLNEQLQQAIDNAFANLSVEGLSNLGEAIGAALSGGDLNAGFKAFTDAVGSALESLGKQMIALSPVIAALKTAIKTLNPAILLPAGIALVAIGAALRNLIGNGLPGFAEGGDPPIGKPSIVGEKGWELFIPKVPGTIVSHEDSLKLISNSAKTSSVKESETIREYLIATRVSQQVKEYFSTTFTENIKEGIRLSLVPIENRISETVKSINTNNDKLTAYSYKLHEQSSQTIEKIASFTDRSSTSSNQLISFEKISDNIKSLKESFHSSSVTDKDHLVKTDSIENFKTIISSLKESFISSTNKETNYRESLATITATISSIKEKLIPYVRPSLDATIVKGDNQFSHYENSFKEIEHILVKNFTNDSTDTSFKTASEKITSSFKELQSTSTKAIERLHESVINNNVSTSIDKIHEKISERSDKSVTIERIINNNFFSSDSFKETFKSMSLTDLQKTFHIPAFAQGGAVFGPTLAILGEGFGISRGNPEFVGTRSQLSGIQSGQFDVNVNVDGELSFSMGKLAIALNREQRSSFRTSGKPPF